MLDKPSEPLSTSSNSRVISLALNDAETGFVLDQEFTENVNEKSLGLQCQHADINHR